MAFASLFTLLDDITAVLDDVALMTKMAAKKTAGVVGDDLALNANQVTGVSAERELPIIWRVAKGSLINKVILIPLALIISWLAPWLISPLLIIGGTFLCFEGVEKLLHKFLHQHDDHQEASADELIDENDKIKGAIRTDFILSAEIIAITLGTVQNSGLSTQIAVLTSIAIVMTIGVYGLVAGIVKIDDAGLHLTVTNAIGSFKHNFGRGILWFAPFMMKGLSIVGTAAMFLVGGGILTHGFPAIHHWVESVTAGQNGIVSGLVSLGTDAATGIAAGAAVLVLVNLVKKTAVK